MSKGRIDISDGSFKVYRDDVTATNDVNRRHGMPRWCTADRGSASPTTAPRQPLSSARDPSAVARPARRDLLTSAVSTTTSILTTVYGTTDSKRAFRLPLVAATVNSDSR